MKFFLDTEFNGFGGDLISIALAPEHGDPVYLCLPMDEIEAMTVAPWVRHHVLPVLSTPGARPEILPRKHWSRRLASYFKAVDDIEFVADWPDDIRYLMQAITVKPGEMIPLPDFTMTLRHVRSWPTPLKDAIRHNALWDARALREAILNPRENGLRESA